MYRKYSTFLDIFLRVRKNIFNTFFILCYWKIKSNSQIYLHSDFIFILKSSLYLPAILWFNKIHKLINFNSIVQKNGKRVLLLPAIGAVVFE